MRKTVGFAALALVIALASCGPRGDGAAEAPEPSPGNDLTALPVADPPLDRRGLLAASAEAASAQAAGRADEERQRKLGGRRFELRLRFGCPGDEDASRRWSFDETQRDLRFRIEADVAAEALSVAGLTSANIDRVQGFSIDRPWLLDAVCPARVARPDEDAEVDSRQASTPPSREATPGTPRLAIVQLFSENDPRTHLGSDRPMTAAVRLSEGQAPSAEGYNLVLAGRLERSVGGRVIACAVDNVDSAPRCMVSASFDRIWLETPDGDEIAHWSAS